MNGLNSGVQNPAKPAEVRSVKPDKPTKSRITKTKLYTNYFIVFVIEWGRSFQIRGGGTAVSLGNEFVKNWYSECY